jgi:hypothetical protein
VILRLLLRPLLLLIGLSSLPVLLIRAQPYDDSDLRAFLTPPDGCPTPCFIYIRPGSTTYMQSVQILQAHQWVEQLGSRQSLSPGIFFMSWMWNDTQPFLAQGDFENYIFSQRNIITSITIKTHIAVIELWWLYGQPAWVHWMETHDAQLYYTFAYPQYDVYASVRVPACTSLLRVLTADSQLSFTNQVNGRPAATLAQENPRLPLAYFRNINPCRDTRLGA